LDLVTGFLSSIELQLRGWALGHMSQITTALTASLLVIFGDDINGFVKDRVRHRHFVVRTVSFILVCAFGFGMLAVFIAPGLASLLRYFGERYLVIVVVGAFVSVGVMAERKKYM
jgi:hypothetical protein